MMGKFRIGALKEALLADVAGSSLGKLERGELTQEQQAKIAEIESTLNTRDLSPFQKQTLTNSKTRAYIIAGLLSIDQALALEMFQKSVLLNDLTFIFIAQGKLSIDQVLSGADGSLPQLLNNGRIEFQLLNSQLKPDFLFESTPKEKEWLLRAMRFIHHGELAEVNVADVLRIVKASIQAMNFVGIPEEAVSGLNDIIFFDKIGGGVLALSTVSTIDVNLLNDFYSEVLRRSSNGMALSYALSSNGMALSYGQKHYMLEAFFELVKFLQDNSLLDNFKRLDPLNKVEVFKIFGPDKSTYSSGSINWDRFGPWLLSYLKSSSLQTATAIRDAQASSGAAGGAEATDSPQP
jgi:hypothetical protein